MALNKLDYIHKMELLLTNFDTILLG